MESPHLEVSLQSVFGGDMSSSKKKSNGRLCKRDKQDKAVDDRNFKNTPWYVDNVWIGK